MLVLIAWLVIFGAIAAVIAKIDVRLVLLLAAFALGILAGKTDVIVRTFFGMLTREQFIIPICCSMGFVFVLKHTGCDQHLVHLLVKPLKKIRFLLLPGAVAVGFLVNIPVISQTSTAVAIGSVLVPLLIAAELSPVTIGAALLMGSSIGGELLNPGAPEFRTVSSAVNVPSSECVVTILPFLIPHLFLSTMLFWFFNYMREKKESKCESSDIAELTTQRQKENSFAINPVKAFIPLLPICLLFLAGPPIGFLKVPARWLVDPQRAEELVLFDTRLIGAAMLTGVVVAGMVSGRFVGGIAQTFFEGAGYAYAQIISLIVAATCFGKGVEELGLARQMGTLIQAQPKILMPTAGFLSFSFACLSGSGMASTQSLFGFFVAPAVSLGVDPVLVGSLVSMAAAAGRTLSPVSAVALMCATLTRTNAIDLIRQIALPLLLSLVTIVLFITFK